MSMLHIVQFCVLYIQILRHPGPLNASSSVLLCVQGSSLVFACPCTFSAKHIINITVLLAAH